MPKEYSRFFMNSQLLVKKEILLVRSATKTKCGLTELVLKTLDRNLRRLWWCNG